MQKNNKLQEKAWLSKQNEALERASTPYTICPIAVTTIFKPLQQYFAGQKLAKQFAAAKVGSQYAAEDEESF